MPQYIYTAIDAAGKHTEGVMEAQTISLVMSRLKEKGLYVIKAEDKADISVKTQASMAKKLKLKPLTVFCRQFATLINAGITAVKSLDILYQQTEDKPLKACIGRIYEAVQKGEAMSEAFRKQGVAFPELLINMIMTGESAGNLDMVLIRMADHYEKENKIRNKIKGAMIYPMVLAALTIVVVVLMVVVVLPSFTGIITSGGGEIPLPTRLLLGLSGFLTKYWYIIIGILALIIIGVRGFKRSEFGHLWWDSKKLRLPVIGKSLRMIYSSRFARTLSTLLSSGIQMLQSIEITSRVIGNQLFVERLNVVVEDIRKGTQLSAAIRKTELFPPMIYNMINVGEESGLLDDILYKTASFYDEESEAAIARLVGLIEPMMIIFMAVIIGFIVISIALPMFTMYGTIGG